MAAERKCHLALLGDSQKEFGQKGTFRMGAMQRPRMSKRGVWGEYVCSLRGQWLEKMLPNHLGVR